MNDIAYKPTSGKPLIIGNWKMNGTLAQAIVFLRKLCALCQKIDTERIDIMVSPPATLLYSLSKALQTTPSLKKSRLLFAGQTCHIRAEGAHTGDISAAMLKEVGASATLVGHSERRKDHFETHEHVARQAQAAWAAGLVPVFCIGETREERAAHRTLSVLDAQLSPLWKLYRGQDIVIAYEPVWAIGTGKLPTAEDITHVHTHLRDCFPVMKGKAYVPLLYGGSVTPANVAAIFSLTQVDGVLVGGASLEAKRFFEIIRACTAERE